MLLRVSCNPQLFCQPSQVYIFCSPKLTWRDLQHIVVVTAKICAPLDSRWTTNGAGIPMPLDKSLICKLALKIEQFRESLGS